MNINIDVRDNNLSAEKAAERARDGLVSFEAAKAKVLAKEVVDPEEVVLLKILEKILNKHNVAGTARRRSYIPFVPRQWETIDDKLRAEVGEAEREVARAPGRDFVREIQE